MDSRPSTIPIRQSDLASLMERANRLLLSVKWVAKPFEVRSTQESNATAWRESAVMSTVPEELSLLQLVKGIAQDPLLLPESINSALTTVRRGLTLGMHLSREYTKFSGLDQLVLLNSKGGLAELQKLEFRKKHQTASAIAVFVFASYVSWELAQFRRDEVATIKLEVPPPPEVFLQDPVRALDCTMFYLAAVIGKAGIVRSELECVRAIRDYCERVVDEIGRRADSFEHADIFTTQIYQLENSEFRVEGFRAIGAEQRVSIEFNRVPLESIVGNREAKHQAKRLVERLLCYDPQTKRNPMFDLGGLPAVTMGFGEPGTGKSLLISAVATLLDERCRELGVPFLFWPMPDTVVSTFQGGSAERMMNWMSALKDPTKLIYAPIDDAENNLEERSRQGVSSGVREVIAVFLRNTEGAYAVNRGNTLIQLFTNLPDQIDKAVLSRVQDRAAISGAVSRDDFLDQDYLWYRKYSELAPGFLPTVRNADYTPLAAQAPLISLGQTDDGYETPRDERIRRLFEEASAKHAPDSMEFFGALFASVKLLFPNFTSRDIRNIQRAVDARLLDFELPTEWSTDPERFFRRDYDTKRAMIVEQMQHHLRGLSFQQIRRRETVRYLDALVTITESGRERRIASLLEEMGVQRAARERFQ